MRQKIKFCISPKPGGVSLAAWFLSVLFIMLFWGYLFVRKGELSLFTLNKSTACMACLLFAYSIFFRDLGILVGKNKKLILSKIYAGKLSYTYFWVHLFLTACLSGTKFTFMEWYPANFIPVCFGLLGMFYLIKLAHKYGARLFGRISNAIPELPFIPLSSAVLLFISFHLINLKFSGWFIWAESGSQFLPPLSLLVFCMLFPVFVIIGIRSVSIKFLRKSYNRIT
jgi:hypothetical protein